MKKIFLTQTFNLQNKFTILTKNVIEKQNDLRYKVLFYDRKSKDLFKLKEDKKLKLELTKIWASGRFFFFSRKTALQQCVNNMSL